MKKCIICIFCILFATQSLVLSQPKNEKGFRAGIAFANTLGDIDNPDFVSGVGFGFFYRNYTKENRAIQYEINYTQKGYSTDIDDFEKNSSLEYTLNYLEVPVLFVFMVPRTPFDYYFGPFGAFFLDGSLGCEYWGIHHSISIPSDEMNTFDIGIMIGGRYAYDKFFIDARSSLGFLSFPKDGTALRNFVIQLSGGVRF